MKVYVADDNLDFANFCADVARSMGWEVAVCEDGACLLQALEGELGPALILCDINMPGLDGIEVIRQISLPPDRFRFRFITGGLPTTALAARLIGDARDIDVGRFMLKPISLKDLKELFESEAKSLFDVDQE